MRRGKEILSVPIDTGPFLLRIRQHVFLAFLKMGYNWCLSVKLVGT
jgi:hypothetical protein